MSLKDSEGKSSCDAGAAAAAGGDTPSVNGKNNEGCVHGNLNPNVHHLSLDTADTSMGSTHVGKWEVTLKKSGATDPEPLGSSTTYVKTWGHSEWAPWQGCGVNGGSMKSPGNNWAQTSDSRKCGPSSPQPRFDEQIKSNVLPQDVSDGEYDSESDKVPHHPDNGSDNDDELLENADDDTSDDYDSDASQKSSEKRNKNKWLGAFFEAMDSLTVEEINKQTRQWHCPACHDGPGAINWFKGLQRLMTHAKTKGSSRVKLHRELAELLEEELQRKGISLLPTVGAFSKWKGLREPTTDHEIVWPPMVVIMNTLLEKDDDKWLGMRNQELLEYFSEYAAVKARCSYSPNAHHGMSLLIFETSAMGYWEAARLHKHFVTDGRGRDAWELHQTKLYPDVKCQLYGYLARKEDIDIFNQHLQGKSILKFNMRSYEQMVVLPMKQISKDNQTVVRLKKKVVAQEQRLKVLEETLIVVSQRLHEKTEEDRIGRLRTSIQHEEYKEEMGYQDQLSKEQIDNVGKSMEKLEEVHVKAKQFNANYGTNEEHNQRKEEEPGSVESQAKGDEHFEVERERVMHAHEAEMVELERKHLAEKLEPREGFAAALARPTGDVLLLPSRHPAALQKM